MDWEFLVILAIALIEISVSIFLLWLRPLVSALIILGVWLELMIGVAWLERRHGRARFENFLE